MVRLHLLDSLTDSINLDLFFSFLLAVLSGLVVYALYGLIKKPKIQVVPTWLSPQMRGAVRSGGEPSPQLINGNERAFFNISILNNGRFSNPARNVRVKLTFYLVEKGAYIARLFTLPVKWDSRPEPVKFEIVEHAGVREIATVGIVEPALIPMAEFTDINPQSEETFCILLKYNNESKAYAFNASSYLYPDLRNPAWELSFGTYDVEVEVVGENVHATKWIGVAIRGKGLEMFPTMDVVIRKKRFWNS